jgi:hypothetical protein
VHPPGNPSRVHAMSKSDVDVGWTRRGCAGGCTPPSFLIRVGERGGVHPPGNPSRVHAASKSDVDVGWTRRGCEGERRCDEQRCNRYAFTPKIRQHINL